MDTLLYVLLAVVVLGFLMKLSVVPTVEVSFLKSRRGRHHHFSYPIKHRRAGLVADYYDAPLILGNDTDRHGCLRSAGYSWDSVTQQCTQPWISHL